MEDLWVSSTDLGRSLYGSIRKEELERAVLGVPSVDCSSISIIALEQKAEEKETNERFL